MLVALAVHFSQHRHDNSPMIWRYRSVLSRVKRHCPLTNKPSASVLFPGDKYPVRSTTQVTRHSRSTREYRHFRRRSHALTRKTTPSYPLLLLQVLHNQVDEIHSVATLLIDIPSTASGHLVTDPRVFPAGCAANVNASQMI